MQTTAPSSEGRKTALQTRLDRSLQRLSRRGKWRKGRAKKAYEKPKPKATVSQASAGAASQETRDRLITDALQHPAFEGMELDAVAAFVNSKLDAYISKYPVWYGHLAKDRPRKPATEAQRAALEKARQRKAAIQHEVDAPYDPAREEEGVRQGVSCSSSSQEETTG